MTSPELRAEFMRSLQLARKYQLTTFRETPVQSIAELLEQFSQQLRNDGAEENSIHSNTSLSIDRDEQHQVSVMRTILHNFLLSYNDPFAGYITPTSLIRYQQRRGGSYVGIGLKYRTVENQYPLIIGPIQGGPLARSDIEPGDQLVSVADVDQWNATSKSISTLMKGEAGSTVKLILRRGEKSHQVVAHRQAVLLRYARSAWLPGNLVLLKVTRFGGKTHETVRREIEIKLSEGATGFVLDLRDNPGGSTRAARGIASAFSDLDTIYCEQLESGKTRHLKRHGIKLTDRPLVVLTNEKSMSSSEIVAGALKHDARATIIGAPTYGKGLIQKVFKLKEPLGGAVRATIAAYATPDHTLIHGVGVTPDIYVETASDGLFVESGSVNISQAARDYRRFLLEEYLRKTYSKQEAAQLVSQADHHLEVAIEVLNK